MASNIRKVSVGTNFKESMNYSVGSHHNIYIKGQDKPTNVQVCNIEETEKSYLIYVNNKDEVHQWKKIPKNDQTSIEYYID